MSARPSVGAQLGPYQLTAQLGEGGMGEVYRALDPRLGREVAIKVLREPIASPLGRARFEREAQAVARLSHPQVLAIYDVGDVDGVPYLVTELLQGETLRARLRRGRVPVAQAVTWAVQIARGLAAAHERGIVHRDLKPENLFVLSSGAIKILDFGLARSLTGGSESGESPSPNPSPSPSPSPSPNPSPSPSPSPSPNPNPSPSPSPNPSPSPSPNPNPNPNPNPSQSPTPSPSPSPSPSPRDPSHDTLSTPGQVIGTVGYLSPEQARGERVTEAADLFALGVILHELLTGERAFPFARDADPRAMLRHEPPPPSSLRAEISPALDRVVARCLSKDVATRFASARDLAFALELSGPQAALAGPAAPAAPRARRRWSLGVALVVPLAALLGVLGALGALGAFGYLRKPGAAPALAPPRSFPITYSGRDRHPSVSADGRFLAFASDRGGSSRIWLQQLDIGREIALTTEGTDLAPRFSPDGHEVLFTRLEGARASLYRVAVIGGEVRKVVEDASDGDWSPDGTQVVFVRSVPNAEGIVQPVLLVIGADGSGERELLRLSGRATRGRGVEQRVRWSPDGALIAVSGYLPLPGMAQQILLVPVDGSAPRTLDTPNRIGLLSAVAWEDAHTIVYSQSLSVSGNSAGSAAQLVRQRLRDGAITTLMWTPESSSVVDRWPGRGLVYDARSARTNLRQVSLTDGAELPLSQGSSTDRQPRLFGDRVIFTSNRGPNLDVWVVDQRKRLSQRLTDHPAEDWDPAMTQDGRHLLWSSNRSGNFEIWGADADGGSPRQITQDGFDAENPTATPDGQWIVYASTAPGRAGVWRIHPDGSAPARVVSDGILPEVSPDGRYVLFQRNRTSQLAVIGVASLDDGQLLPFEIQVEVHAHGQAVLGRARWMPDGRAIAFVGQDPSGASGVFVQPFDPQADTTAARARLAGFDPDRSTESFDVSATSIVLAETDQRAEILAVTGLPP